MSELAVRLRLSTTDVGNVLRFLVKYGFAESVVAGAERFKIHGDSLSPMIAVRILKHARQERNRRHHPRSMNCS